MLQITVDINGRKIGQIAAVNTGTQSGTNKYDVYDTSTVNPGESIIESGTYLTSVTHTYDDGAAVLIEKVMAELEELP